MPIKTRCWSCGRWEAVMVCTLCKEERPTYTALKNITRKHREEARAKVRQLPRRAVCP